LESELPLDTVILQSNVYIDILNLHEIPATSNVQTEDPTNPDNAFSLILNCSSDVKRLELRVRTSEGLDGQINVLMVPQSDDSNIAKCLTVPIKPLNLHEKVEQLPSQTKDIGMSSITMSGNFSESELHGWMEKAIPEVPPVVGDSALLFFKSTFIGSYLSCKLEPGSITIASNNLSALTILKDTITQEASLKKVQLDIKSNIRDVSVEENLKLLHPRLDKQYSLAKHVQMIDALKEITSEEEDTSFLSEDLQEILKNGDKIRENFKR